MPKIKNRAVTKVMNYSNKSKRPISPGRDAGHGVDTRNNRVERTSIGPHDLPSSPQTTTKMPSEPDGKQDKRENAAQARQVIDVFHEISTLLVYISPTGLVSI